MSKQFFFLSIISIHIHDAAIFSVKKQINNINQRKKEQVMGTSITNKQSGICVNKDQSSRQPNRLNGCTGNCRRELLLENSEFFL